MEIVTIGKVVVPAKIENMNDLLNAQPGHGQPEQVRAVEVPDALVDTGAMVLSLPKRLIERTRAHQAGAYECGGRGIWDVRTGPADRPGS